MLIAIVILCFLLLPHALSGQLYMWTDKKGVTHVSDQPPKEDLEIKETIEYREMKEADSRREQYKSEIQDIKRKYDRKIEDVTRDIRKSRSISDQEYRDKKNQIEGEKREREINSAKRRVEYLKSREADYRQYYHDAKTANNRNYWYNKMKEVSEAESELMRLQNKR
jgi:hypothetical protein